MPLNAVVADINSVDETVRGFYKETDGKYVLDVAASDGFALENVSGLKTAVSKERKRADDAEANLKAYEGLDATAARNALAAISAFGDITPEKAKEAIETAARLSAFDPEKEADKLAAQKVKDTETQLKAAFDQQIADLTARLESATKNAEGLKSQLNTLMIDNVVKSGLAALNPLDDARDAIELLAKQAIRLTEKDEQVAVEVVDAQGLPRINTDLTPVTVAQYLAELRETKPGLFKPDPIQGLGTKPGGNAPQTSTTSNPWKKETQNLTEQMRITKENPELAKRLKAEAGR